ncbi:MAG: HAD hydrolase family protein [Anaerobutyricum sp.]
MISSRSASCIYPILKKHHFQCPIVACGGAWIEDMNGRILSNEGMSRQTAATISSNLHDREEFRSRYGASIPERTGLQVTEPMLVFSMKKVLQVKREGTVALLPDDAVVNKFLSLCNLLAAFFRLKKI